MISGGGVSLNKQKIETETQVVTTEHLINQKYLLVQKGKKNYYLIKV
jgi:tyrosyl-tRNA synthetase